MVKKIILPGTQTRLGRKIEADPLDLDKITDFIHDIANFTIHPSDNTRVLVYPNGKGGLEMTLDLSDSKNQEAPPGLVLAYGLVKGYYCYELNSDNQYEKVYGFMYRSVKRMSVIMQKCKS